MGGKGKQPEPIDPGLAMGEYMFGKGFSSFQGVTDPRLQERIIGAEERYRPRYTALELKDIETMALGTADTKGLFGLLEESSRMAGRLQQEQIAEQRAQDVSALREYAPQVVEAYREADPYSAGLADLQRAQAEVMFKEAEGELSPERRRMADQAALSASLAQGRALDQSSIASQLLGREQVRSQLRNQAMGAGQMAFGMARSMAGDLGSTILGRPSQAISLGGQILSSAQQGAAGPMGPQLFDPNVGLNMALSQRGQDIDFMGAKAAAQGQMVGALGQVAGSALTAYAI